jgi:hypothetical protein
VPKHQRALTVACIIPTGIGASIGGFGGDAMTLLPLLSEVCDTVITHPNVANAACFQTLPQNVLYVEGYGLDQFLKQQWALSPVHRNRVGVIWDSGISETMKILHLNTIQAVQTVYGVDVVGIQDTESPVSLGFQPTPSGRSAGSVLNPEILLEAAKKLIAQGANALAVCCLMPQPDDMQEEAAYKMEGGVDPIGGLEAQISHYLVSQLRMPCAHAPVFSDEAACPETTKVLDPRASSEFIVSTFLPCVLTGLSRAPQFGETGLVFQDLDAIILPYSALGGVASVVARAFGIPVFAVENNQTVLEVAHAYDSLTVCKNYLEVLGHLVALRSGVFIPPHFLH